MICSLKTLGNPKNPSLTIFDVDLSVAGSLVEIQAKIDEISLYACQIREGIQEETFHLPMSPIDVIRQLITQETFLVWWISIPADLRRIRVLILFVIKATQVTSIHNESSNHGRSFKENTMSVQIRSVYLQWHDLSRYRMRMVRAFSGMLLLRRSRMKYTGC